MTFANCAPTILPFASISPANVVTPAMLTLSKFVCPSMSKSPVAYIFPVTLTP